MSCFVQGIGNRVALDVGTIVVVWLVTHEMEKEKKVFVVSAKLMFRLLHASAAAALSCTMKYICFPLPLGG